MLARTGTRREISSKRARSMGTPLRRGHPGVTRVGGGYGGGSREGHAEDLGDGGHGRGCSHGHAVARRAGDTVFYLFPLALSDGARALLVPILPHVAAAS